MQYDYQVKFMPEWDNVAAVLAPTPIASPGSDDIEPDLVQMLHRTLKHQSP